MYVCDMIGNNLTVEVVEVQPFLSGRVRARWLGGWRSSADLGIVLFGPCDTERFEH